ncbi:Heme/hemopexin-binding protein precursor [compost metagenome]
MLAVSVRCAFLPPLLATFLSIAGMGNAVANPSNPTVVNGQVTFSQQGNVFTITNSPSAIINWSSFSINANEMVRFIQRNASSSVLNRITGQDPSRIMGALESNGRVFLINPNGIMFGAGAQVNVAGLVASTLNISNSDFLAGKNKFLAGDVAGAVSNLGAITTPSGGQVYLIAPDVNNSGIITSPQGEVVLAAGRSVQLADSSNPDMHVVVSAPTDKALNLGEVIAQGGKIGIYAALINQRGKLNANSAVVGQNGKIVLKASDITLLEAGSTTTATGSNLNKGGEILLLGDKVGLTGDAVVDASGESGGGKVLIGGDYQGKNDAVPNASATYVGKDVRISADATVNGNGGTVVVWGDQVARMYGSLSARGGMAGGNGGLVETSGNYLDIAGARVNTSAPWGKTGDWLLDPYDIEVVAGRGGSLTDVVTFGAGSATGVTSIGADLISESSSNVRLQAKHDISFNSSIINNSAVSLTAQAGNDIKVNASIDMAGGVTLSANDAASGSASGMGGVTLADIGGSDIVRTNGSTLTLTGSYLSINGSVDLGGGDLDARANVAGGFITIGANGRISTDGSTPSLISFVADNINLNGADASIGSGTSNGDDTVAFSTYTANRDIVLGGTASGKLGLSASGLRSVSGGTLAIGHSAAGSIASGGAVNLNGIGNLSLESGADISLNHALTVSGALTAAVDGNASTLAIGATGVINADNVTLIGDKMSLGGSVTSNNEINVNSYTSNRLINLGAADSASQLGLTTAELNTLHAPVLNIGNAAGRTGALTVSQAIDLSSGTSATTRLSLGGGAISVTDALKVQGALNVSSSGAISGNGALTAGNVTLDGASVSLTGNNLVGSLQGSASSGDFEFKADAIHIAGAGISALNGNTKLTANSGGIVQDASAAVKTQKLTLDTSGAVTLNASTNQINTLAASGASSLALTNAAGHALTLDSITMGGSAPNASLNISAGNITVAQAINANGSDVQLNGSDVIGSGAITAGTLNVQASGTMSLTGANQVGTVRGNSVGDFGFNAAGDVTLGSISSSTSVSLSAGGNITQGSGSYLITPQLNVTTPGAVSIGGNVNAIDTLNATNVGSLTLVNPGDITLGTSSLSGNYAGGGVIDVSSTFGNVTVAGIINAKTNGKIALAANNVTVNAAMAADSFDISANNLSLGANLSGNVASIKPWGNGYSMVIGSGTTCGTNCLAVNDMYRLLVSTIALGSSNPARQVGPIAIDSISGVGTSASSISSTTKTIGLLNSAGDITQTGVINVRDLAIETAGQITLNNAGNTVSNLAVRQTGANNNTIFSNTGTVAIAKLQDASTTTQYFNIDGVSSEGNVTIDTMGAVVRANGAAGGTLSAQTLTLNTSGGVGTSASPLITQVAELSATNTAGSGSTAPINIANTGTLLVHDVKQVDAGGGNNGAIKIDNTGNMTVAGLVSTSTGAITLQTRNGTLAMDGSAVSNSGNIVLAAGTVYDPNTSLIIGSNAAVSSTTGTVNLIATNYTSNGGSVTDRNGAVTPTFLLEPPATPVLSANICSVDPGSALCQALLPPTASSPYKPVTQALNTIVSLRNAPTSLTDLTKRQFFDIGSSSDSATTENNAAAVIEN